MYQSLDIDLSWKAGDLVSFLPIILALVFFIIYWFTAASPRVRKYFYEKYEFDEASYRHIFFTKIFGFFSMGVFPIIICLLFLKDFSLSYYGLVYIEQTVMYSVIWTLGLSVLVIPLVHFSARKPKNLVNYPQIRAKVWTSKMVYMNALGWFLYLF